jgi:hypothetical protein
MVCVMDVDLRRLPHWSRVAFAARCARRVRPLFEEAWPDAAAIRKEAVDRAIVLAEHCAAKGQSVGELKQAVLGALMAAGQAQIPHLFPIANDNSEAPPLDRESAVVASLSAKVAEKAAEAARSKPSESVQPVHEAFYFALDAIRAAGRLGLVEVLEADFVALVDLAPKKPWWRFW